VGKDFQLCLMGGLRHRLPAPVVVVELAVLGVMPEQLLQVVKVELENLRL
jgi:hypothetical protein